jgi:predicted transcriptional regulator
MSKTRTFAVQGKAPGWMYIAPIHALTHDQWQAAEIVIMHSSVYGPQTAAAIAAKARVSVDVVNRAMKKLVEMGLVKRIKGGRAPRYDRKYYNR